MNIFLISYCGLEFKMCFLISEVKAVCDNFDQIETFLCVFNEHLKVKNLQIKVSRSQRKTLN